jgi:hypothetical protein
MLNAEKLVWRSVFFILVPPSANPTFVLCANSSALTSADWPKLIPQSTHARRKPQMEHLPKAKKTANCLCTNIGH